MSNIPDVQLNGVDEDRAHHNPDQQRIEILLSVVFA